MLLLPVSWGRVTEQPWRRLRLGGGRDRGTRLSPPPRFQRRERSFHPRRDGGGRLPYPHHSPRFAPRPPRAPRARGWVGQPQEPGPRGRLSGARSRSSQRSLASHLLGLPCPLLSSPSPPPVFHHFTPCFFVLSFRLFLFFTILTGEGERQQCPRGKRRAPCRPQGVAWGSRCLT